MKTFMVHDEKGRVIGNIDLHDDVVNYIGTFHPNMILGYTVNEHDPENILAFNILLEPVVPKSPGEIIALVDQCKFCGTKESVRWWKCCPEHTTEQGNDVVCQKCKDEKHPICGAVRPGGWGLQLSCGWEKGHTTPHSWMVGF